ncbi:MAG TPA: amidohydrolase [Kofleriaceae bacterium]|jgi:amidohydrolase|nr:amidohydrolase [Kofleriaceae bacterium]
MTLSGSRPERSELEQTLLALVDARAAGLTDKVIAWRRDLHAHPELGNREHRTSEVVAAHLRALGLEVQTGVAHTGVVGVLRGGRPGPVVALRADMDALPVTEEADVAFASRVTTQYNGAEVGVMHACGHDCHTAVLMGVAELFAGIRDQLPGAIKFVFQPAEEGAPDGERGGAELMIAEGVLDQEPKPQAIFGLHVLSQLSAGVIGFRAGPTMASADWLNITIHGRQTHGAMPWLGADPIVGAAHVILGLQTVVSRQVDTVAQPAIVTIGAIHGGVRENIIPDRVEMKGTIRAFDEALRSEIHQRVQETAEHHARGCRCEADVRVRAKYPVTINHPELTAWSAPRLTRVAGADHVLEIPKIAGAEDFSFFQRRIPGFFYFVGITPADQRPTDAPANHSPLFYVDESALPVALRSLASLAAGYLAAPL